MRYNISLRGAYAKAGLKRAVSEQFGTEIVKWLEWCVFLNRERMVMLSEKNYLKKQRIACSAWGSLKKRLKNVETKTIEIEYGVEHHKVKDRLNEEEEDFIRACGKHRPLWR